MAIDTAEKRKAISGILLPLIPGVTPNTLQDAEWRKQAGWSYSITGVSVVVGQGNTLVGDALEMLYGKRKIFFTDGDDIRIFDG